MTCGGCGRANREGATFCAGCGSRLLTRFRISGRREGGYFAQEAWIVSGLRDGRISRHEQFVIDKRADAEACFATLAPD